ncbi:hypothetical protein TPAU25S_03687 [Tsukamurella paurometabola]|nr:Uncharacterised protein [Tsukamurella paurometabola]
MRQRQHRQWHQPQRVLRTPHLVHQKESGHQEKRKLGHAGPTRSLQRQVGHARDHQHEQPQRDHVGQRRGTASGALTAEYPATGEGTDHGVDRIHIDRADRVAVEELPPALGPQREHRKIHREPGGRGRGCGGRPGAKQACAQAQQQQHHQQERRIQLGCGAQTDDHARPGRPVTRPEKQGDRSGGDGDRVEVGEGMHDHQWRGGHQHGVPGPATGPG